MHGHSGPMQTASINMILRFTQQQLLKWQSVGEWPIFQRLNLHNPLISFLTDSNDPLLINECFKVVINLAVWEVNICVFYINENFQNKVKIVSFLINFTLYY